MLGEEMLILILKGPPAIDGLKLPVKERNQYVFKGEAGCMWCMRVWASLVRIQKDTAPRPEGKKEHYHILRSSGFIFQHCTYVQNCDTCEKYV